MKTMLRFFFALGVLTFGITFVQATDTNQPTGFRLTVELQDGSKLIGKAGDETYQFRSDVLGEMKLPLEKIRSFECSAKTNAVKLTTSSGDTLSAQIAMKEVRIETAFGSFRLSVNLIKRAQISPLGKFGQARPGLVALWSGEDDGNDSINGNNAALTDVSFADGKVGKAFVFNGDISLITAPPSTSLAVSNLTFEGWIFPTDLNQPRPIIDYGGGGQSSCAMLWINTAGGSSLVPGALYAVIRDQSGLNYFVEVKSASGTVTLNRWNQVAFTYDTATRAGILYCNGVQVGFSTSSAPLVPQSFCPVNLGCRDVNSLDILRGYRFAGLLDEIAIYNRALSAEEIKAIGMEENNGEPLPPPTPNIQRPRFFNGVSHDVFN
jgi:hypothetical protein